jgi:hypothetical protein
VVYSEIVLSPGSAEVISFTVKDANKQPVDFTLGNWSARLSIIRYPGCLDTPFHTTGTTGVTGVNTQWLNLVVTKDGAGKATLSQLTLTPDPAVTGPWNFTRYHYDCFLTGPNLSSKPILLVHGPFIMDL